MWLKFFLVRYCCLNYDLLNITEEFSCFDDYIESEKNIKIVASSDFTHYESPKEAQRRDKPVIDALLNLNLAEAVSSQKKLQASICGFGPILTFLSCAIELQAINPKLLAYGHSGDTCGSMESVVAYASISASFN